MAADSGRFGAIDCVLRGARSLGANWELAIAVFLQLLLTAGLMLTGLLVPLAGLGIDLLDGLGGAGRDWPQALGDDLAAGLAAALPAPLLLALAAALAIWLLAFLVYCYFQAGTVGILALAEHRAGSAAVSRRQFRVISVSAFHQQARRLFWRCFWLDHLLSAVFLLWGFMLAALAGLVGQIAIAGRVGTSVAIGCVGMAPLGAGLLVALWWAVLAVADAGRPSSGVWTAGRRAWQTLKRRFGAVLLLWLLAAVGWMAIGSAALPAAWLIGLGAGDRWSVWLAARGLLAMGESLAGAALFVALLAACLSLLRGRLEAVA